MPCPSRRCSAHFSPHRPSALAQTPPRVSVKGFQRDSIPLAAGGTSLSSFLAALTLLRLLLSVGRPQTWRRTECAAKQEPSTCFGDSDRNDIESSLSERKPQSVRTGSFLCSFVWNVSLGQRFGRAFDCLPPNRPAWHIVQRKGHDLRRFKGLVP